MLKTCSIFFSLLIVFLLLQGFAQTQSTYSRDNNQNSIARCGDSSKRFPKELDIPKGKTLILDCEVDITDDLLSSKKNSYTIEGTLVVLPGFYIRSYNEKFSLKVDGGRIDLCGGEIDILGDIHVVNGGVIFIGAGSLGIKERFTSSNQGTIYVNESTIVTGESCSNVFGGHGYLESQFMHSHIGMTVMMNGTWIHEAQALSTSIDSNFKISRTGFVLITGNSPITGQGKIINYGRTLIITNAYIGLTFNNFGEITIENGCLTLSEPFFLLSPQSVINLIQSTIIFAREMSKLMSGRIRAKDLPALPSKIIIADKTIQYIPIIGNIIVIVTDEAELHQYAEIETSGDVIILGKSIHYWNRGSIRGPASFYKNSLLSKTSYNGCSERGLGKSAQINGKFSMFNCAPLYLEGASILTVLRDGNLQMNVQSEIAGTGTIINYGSVRISPGSVVTAAGDSAGVIEYGQLTW